MGSAPRSKGPRSDFSVSPQTARLQPERVWAPHLPGAVWLRLRTSGTDASSAVLSSSPTLGQPHPLNLGLCYWTAVYPGIPKEGVSGVTSQVPGEGEGDAARADPPHETLVSPSLPPSLTERSPCGAGVWASSLRTSPWPGSVMGRTKPRTWS